MTFTVKKRENGKNSRKVWNTEHSWPSEIKTESLYMKVKELNKSKLPVVRIDSSLEKYKDKVLFKSKLDKANEMLKTTGLPKSKRPHG